MAFDYSSVKNKKRKDEKTSGFNYSSVVGKTERTDEEKREYVKQRNSQKNDVSGRQQVTYAGKYDSAKGKTGYSNYLKSKEPKSNNIDFGNLLSLAGYTAGSNTSAPNLTETAYALRTDTSYKEPSDDWLDEEKNIFGYLWENDRAAAEKYATEVNNAINQYQKDLESKKVADYSTENVWQGALASASSIASNALSGADYLADLVEYNARGVVTEKEDYLTPYEYTQAVRGSIASDLNEYGTVAGKGLGDLYQIGMSAADSFVLGHLGVAGPAFFGVGATSAMNEARERGVSEGQAFTYGLAAGTMEAAFESLGIEQMLKIKSPHTLKQAFTGILKQSGVEALEEMGTELTNAAWDTLINMDKSEFVASYANYISEGKTRAEALARAFVDLGGEVLWAGISGALAGTISGSVQTGLAKTAETFGDVGNKAEIKKAIKNMGEDKSAVIDYAMNAEEGTEVRRAAEDIKARAEKGETISDKEYADILMKADDNFATAEIKHQLENEAVSTGEALTDEQLDSLSTAVLKTMRGGLISESENAQIEQSKTAKNVYARNMGVDYTYGEQLSKEKKAELKETRTQQVFTEAVKGYSESYKQTLTKAYEDYAQSNEAFKMDAENFADEFSTFYDIGRAGVESIDRALEAYGKGNPQLTNALEQAYVLGRGEAVAANKANIENRQAEIDTKLQESKGNNVNSVGQVRLATETELKNPKLAAVGGKVVTKGKKLSKQHRAKLQFIREFSKLSGVNIVLFEGGKSWGWYDSVNNEIYLNIEEGMSLKTLSHELTHFIQQHSPKHYEEFKQFLLDYYKENGKYQELLEQAHAKQEDLSAEELEDEIIANACQMFISDTEAMQKLIDTQSKGLIETITRWFKDMCDYLRQAFEGVKASHAAAQALEEDIEMLEKARDKWYELLNESITVNKQIGTNAKNQARNYDGSKQQFELKEYSAEEKARHVADAKKYFGTTYNWNEAGYLLTDGSRLDFSGKKFGGSSGYRSIDHREIDDAFDYEYGTESTTEPMIQFMQEGNIRIMPESGGINIAVKPTKDQYDSLGDFISRNRGEVILDIDDAKGNTIVSAEYNKGTYYKKVIDDIKAYFENGTIPKGSESEVGKYRFEMKDSEGNELSPEQKEYFRDSKARDENGNLLVLYHGGYYDTVFTGRGEGFTYNRNAIYMSEREDIASAFSYGAGNTRGNVYKLYANIKNPFVIDAEGRSYVDIPIPDDAPESLKDKFWYDNTADLDNLPVWAEREGYDGIIVYNVREGVGGGPATEVIAFRSNQVKFVDNKAPTKDPDIRFEIKENFYKEYDAWDKKDTNKTFVVGITSEALKSVGVKEQNVVLRSGTVLQKIKNHKEMTFDKFREIPDLLEKPVIIQFSDAINPKTKKPKYESRITVLGEVYADGKPVLVSLELLPTNQKKTVVLDFAVITSAYKKEALQQYINENTILYIDPNKKRTDKWLSLNRLQLPLGENQYGSIRKIAYSDGKVKVQKSKNATAIQKAMEEAGVVDDYGNFKFELKDEDENRLEILENQEERLVNDLKTLEKYYGDAIRQVYEQDIKPNEGISKRAEELNRKAATRFINEVGAMFHVPKDTREEYLLPIINEIIDKGPAISDSEGLIDRLYQTAYEHTEDYIVDTDPEGNYKNLRDYIRKTSIFVNAGIKADVGDYNNFRKRNMGSLRLTNDQTALGLDEFYEEVSNLAPEIFTGTTDGAEQLYELSSFMKDRGRTESIGDFMPQAEYTVWADETLEPELNKLFDSTIGSFLSESTRKEKERQRAAKVDRAMENVTGAIKNYEAAQDYARAEGVLAGQIEQGKKDAAEMRRMQESFERKAKNYEDMIEAKREKIKEIRQRRDEILAERAEAYRKYREERTESIRGGAFRKRIERNAKTLGDWLLKNSDKEHIPEALKSTVGEFLASIDFTSKRALEGGKETQKDANFGVRLNNLAQVLRKQQDYMNSANEDKESAIDAYLDLPAGFAEEVSDLAKDVLNASAQKGFTVNQMNSGQLAQLDKMLRVLKTSISKMNKLIANAHYASVTEAAKSSMRELNAYKEHKPYGELADKAINVLDWDMYTPVYAFKRYGKAGEAIFDGIRNGWDNFAFAVKKVLDFTQNTYTEKEVKEWEKETHTIEISDGSKVTLTTAQLMSLYCLNKREQSRGHIYGGGIRIADINKGKAKLQQADAYLVSFEDVENLIAELTDRQIDVADKLQKFMTEQGSEWGNAVSMERFGYRAFTEDNYFPIESDPNNLIAVDPEAKANDMFRLLNMSATKSLTKNANNAIVISDIFDVFSNHMSDMAKYGTLALPILDTMKWYNYKVKYDRDNGQFVTETVQKSVERVYGKAGKSYFTTFMKDLNGVREGGRGEGLARKMVSNYKIASVCANVRVAVLQPTSIVRATMVIEPKYLLRAMVKLPAAKEAEKKSGIALWKSMGFYNTDIARGVREQIKGGGKTVDKIRDKTMILAEQMDRITWGTLWNAAKFKAEEKGYSGAELDSKTKEYFEEVIYKTQVVDSTLTRSSLMRSSSMFVSSSMAFMAEPTLSYNMIAEEIYNMRKENDFATGWKKYGNKFEKAIAVYAASSLATAILESVPDAIRDDDDEEWFGEKWWQAFWGEKFFEGNLVSEFNVFEKIPFIKDFISLRKGYEIQRLDAAWLASFNKAIEINTELYNVYVKGEKPTKTTYWGKMTPYGALYANLRALSQATGLPVSNMTRDVVAIWNMIVGSMAPSLKVKTYDDSKKK